MQSLKTAGEFNIFVLNDHMQSNTNCEGRVAVRNNATYLNYSIGNT